VSTTQPPAAPSSALAIAVGLVLLVGAALPMHWGLLPAVVAFVLALALGWSRLRRRGAIDWAVLLGARRPVVRWAVLGATVFTAVVVASVCAQGVAAIAVAQPGSIAAIALVLVVALVGGWVGPSRAAAIALAVTAALLVPLVALFGARYEADGAEARGWAQSGPIHGIHPFQTTAVIVDGYGPFDLPINDYVEPLGGRGYDPTTFAAAIERSLHAIAEVHFADGPARARMAFADAKASAVTTEPVLERLDRPSTEATHPRFWVQSGTTGQRSRVEFVCPGRRDDPRGPQPETPMQRMCPDKYANEASAGLGVTGRWPGYAEIRGNERVGLAQLFGWTRSDDAIGRAHVRWEVRIGAWIVIAIAIAIAVRVGARAYGSASIVGVIAVPLVALLAVVVIVAGVGATDVASIPAIARAPRWMSLWHAPTWIAALAWPAALGLALWVEPAAPQDPARRDFVGSRAHVWLLGAVAIASTVLLVATDLDATRWAVPDLGGSVTALPFEDFTIALADRFGERLGLDILQIEAIVGALVGSLLALACVAVLGVVGTAALAVFRAAPASDGVELRARLVVVATAVLCLALVVSRKTEGGSALIPVAMAAAWVLGSTMDEIRRRGPTARTGPTVSRATVLLAWMALGVALAVQGGALASPEDPLRLLYGLLGLVAVALPIAVLLPDREPVATAGSPGSPALDSA